MGPCLNKRPWLENGLDNPALLLNKVYFVYNAFRRTKGHLSMVFRHVVIPVWIFTSQMEAVTGLCLSVSYRQWAEGAIQAKKVPCVI